MNHHLHFHGPGAHYKNPPYYRHSHPRRSHPWNQMSEEGTVTETTKGFTEWLVNKKCPACGAVGKLETVTRNIDKLNDYRCTSCLTEGITIVDIMHGPKGTSFFVGPDPDRGCCWAGEGCCENMP